MNLKMNAFLTFALCAIVFACSAITFGQSEQTRAHFSLYGMHFVGAGQTVRVSVQNPRVSDPGEIQPCVRVRIAFDVYEPAADGSVRLLFAQGACQREILLDGGEAATFDFAAGRNGDWVSPAVFARCEEYCPSDGYRMRVLSTAAIRQGGSTVLLLPAVLKGFDPQPDPPSARTQ